MNYGSFEVELHPKGKVLKKLDEMGYSREIINSSKIIYLTNKVYNSNEREEIITHYRSNDYSVVKTLLKISPYSAHFKKLKYLSSENLIGDSKAEAYEKREHLLNIGRKNTIFIKSLVRKEYRVYAIELDKEVLKKKKFIDNNPKYKPNMKCLYIGQTSKSAEERFFDHINNPRLGSYWVRKFSISRVHNDSDQSKLLRNILNTPISNLTYAESLILEQEASIKLREIGYGVWFA